MIIKEEDAVAAGVNRRASASSNAGSVRLPPYTPTAQPGQPSSRLAPMPESPEELTSDLSSASPSHFSTFSQPSSPSSSHAEPPLHPSSPSRSRACSPLSGGSRPNQTLRPDPTRRPSGTNFVHECRSYSSIRARYALDSSLPERKPSGPPSPSTSGSGFGSGHGFGSGSGFFSSEPKRNLKLETQTGHIDAHILIVDGGGAVLGQGAGAEQRRGNASGASTKAAGRTTIEMTSVHGSIVARVRAAEDEERPRSTASPFGPPGSQAYAASTGAQNRPPLWISARAQNGSVTLYLPRSFSGPVRVLSRNGGVALSPAIQGSYVLVDELKKSMLNWTSRHHYFVGPLGSGPSGVGALKADAERAMDPSEPWTGDEVQLEVINGSARILFVDEENESPAGSAGVKYMISSGAARAVERVVEVVSELQRVGASGSRDKERDIG